MKAIQIQGLKKFYGDHEVLHGISFDVEAGEIFGLLGVNGAGKTTTLECLEGIKSFDATHISVNGSRGVQLQSASLPNAMKVREAVVLFAKYKKTEIDWSMFNKLGLSDLQKQTYKSLSTGQKRRLHLMIALLGDPDILFLDEPTAGLDVEARSILHILIKDLKKIGKTIILASHDMSEVEELCDRLAILKDGKIAYLGSYEDLANRQDISTIQIRCEQDISAIKFKYADFMKVHHDLYEFQSKDVVSAVSEILTASQKAGFVMRDIQIRRVSLEESFLKIAREDVE